MNDGDITGVVVEEMRKCGCMVKSSRSGSIKTIYDYIFIRDGSIYAGVTRDMSDPDFDIISFCVNYYNKELDNLRRREGYLLLIIMMAILANVILAMYVFRQPYCLFSLLPLTVCISFSLTYIRAILFKIVTIPYRIGGSKCPK